MAIRDNTICFVELPSTDLMKSRAFYSALFGWEFEEVPGMNYLLFSANGGISGGFRKVSHISPDQGVIASIAVKDIHETLDRVESNGGSIIMPKTPLPGKRGFIADFADPFGVICRLWSPCRDPADESLLSIWEEGKQALQEPKPAAL
jgi:predicted enzyme related to lactoylglutathione lyase